MRRIFKPCPVDSPATCVGSWANLSPMTSGRWYPTIVTLGDGTNIIIGGSTKNLDFSVLLASDNNPTYEYYPSKPGAWPKTLDILNWAFPFMLYPPASVLPSGGVFVFVSNKTVVIDPTTDTIKNLPDAPLLDHSPWIYPYTPTWTILPMTIKNNFTHELMICGGSRGGANHIEASNLCMRIQADAPDAKWVPSTPMPRKRVMPDSILLPGIIFLTNVNIGNRWKDLICQWCRRRFGWWRSWSS